VDVDARDGDAYGAAEVEIGLAGKIRMNPALHADLGRAAVPCLLGARRDLVE
jgi:hypothetical protein